MKTGQNIRSASLLLWIGFVLAISFMEAWLKFQAPGITLALGLGIGKLVFGALNKVEWFFALIILVSQLMPMRKIRLRYFLPVGLAIVILILETLLLLPLLDARAGIVIAGGHPQPSLLHFYYIAAELLKVGLLALAAVQSLNGNCDAQKIIESRITSPKI